MEIQKIRELLSQGETGKALEVFIALLEKDGRFKENLLRTLRVSEANYNAVRQQELKGILPFQEAQREYSRVNDTILAVLDDVEAGRVPTGPAAQRPNRTVLFAGAGIVLLLLVVFAVLKLRKKEPECPGFEDKSALHILVLPFDNIGDKEARPELLIQGNIQSLTEKAKIPVEVKTASERIKSDALSQKAGELGRECNADLVIYGQYKAFEKDSIRVKMGFRFLKHNGPMSSGPFRTFADITEIQPTRDLEDAIFSLCSMIAIRNRNWEFAQRWMNKIRNKDDTDNMMAGWLAKRMGAN